MRRTLCVLVLCLPVAANAQQAPEAGYALPAAVSIGTTTDVVLGGYDWTEDTQFFVMEPGVHIEVVSGLSEMLFPGPPHWFGPKATNKAFLVPRELKARITVPPDFTGHTIHWRVANANGVSGLRTLLVSPSVAISEDETRPSTTAQPLPTLPCTVCGRLKQKEEIDRYTFVADGDGLVNCCIESQGFGFGINAAVQIRNSAGNVISDTADTEGTGLTTTFSVRRGEQYSIQLHDIDFRGNRSMVYRMSLAAGPRILTAIPARGQRSAHSKVTFTGIGLKTGHPTIETVTAEVRFPADPNLSTWRYTLATSAGGATFDFKLEDVEQQIESQGDNETIDQLPLPSQVTGFLKETESIDSYRITAQKGEELEIDVSAKSIGSPLDVAVAVLNESGKAIASADDGATSTDASLVVRIPADGHYTINITDAAGTAGSPTAIYHLSVKPTAKTFELDVPEIVIVPYDVDPPQAPEKRRKGKEPPGLLYVDVTRTEQTTGPIKVSIDGLPEGLVIPDEVVIAETESSVAVALAARGSSLASLATITCHTEGHEPVSARVLVVPVMKTRARVRPLYPDAGRTVHRGATYRAPVVVTRVEDYSGEVELQMAAKPDRVSQGIFGKPISVPADVSDVEFPIFLPEWVQIDRTSRIVLNTFVRVPDNQGQPRTLVQRMDQRITMNVEGTLLSISMDRSEFTSGHDQPIEVPVRIHRSPKLKNDVEVRVISNEDTQVTSIKVPVSADSGIVQLPPMPAGESERERIFRVEAVARDGDRLLAMSSTSIVVLAP